MTPELFAYWLQGFVELHGEQPTPEQWQMIKDHLQTVFKKVTPDRVGTTPSFDEAIQNLNKQEKKEVVFYC